jgi:tetratricopeptide (TPR) repeat protein
MKRLAAESAEYEAARKSFVEVAHQNSLEAKKGGEVKRARDLAGYASQYDPENKELATLRDALQAEFLGTTQNVLGGTNNSTNNAEVADGSTTTGSEIEVAESDVEPESVEPEKVEKKEKVVAVKEKKETKKEKKEEKVEEPKEDSTKLIAQAKSAYSRGNADAAEKLYKQALASSPSNHQIHAGLGKIYFDRASYAKAVQYQNQAVKYRPGSIPYRISLGQSYYRLGKYKDAIRVWEAALKKDPNNTSAKKYIELAKRKLN